MSGPRQDPSVDGFAPFRVGKLGWYVIRGRRAQNPAPLPTATHLQPLRGSDEKADYIDLGSVRVGLAKRAGEWQRSGRHRRIATERLRIGPPTLNIALAAVPGMPP